MALVSITINGRPYPVACGDGEEERIRELARYVDAKVAGFAKQIGQIGESRLLVLAALVIADELNDARPAPRGESEQAPAPPAANGTGLDEERLAANMENLAARIEEIAARLETSHI